MDECTYIPITCILQVKVEKGYNAFLKVEIIWSKRGLFRKFQLSEFYTLTIPYYTEKFRKALYLTKVYVVLDHNWAKIAHLA